MHVTAAGWSRSLSERRDGSAGGAGDDSFSLMAQAGSQGAGTMAGGAGSWTPTPASFSTLKLSAALSGASTLVNPVAAAKLQPVEAEFFEWARMSPAERIRAQVLKEHSLTEDGLKELEPDERKAIEKEIADRIKRELGGMKAEDRHEDDLVKTA